MQIKPKVTTYFTLWGKFNPDEITKKIGLKPNRTFRFGEFVQNTKMKCKHDAWKILIDEVETYSLDDQIKKILEIVYPKKDKILKICEEMNIEIEFSFAVFVHENHYPAFWFSKEVINKIAEFNADLDVDMY